MSDDLALDHETVSAQLEVCSGRGSERWLACGHARHTHSTDAVLCRRCGSVQAVMTGERIRAELAKLDREVRLHEEWAAGARMRRAQWMERASANGGHDE